MWQSFHNNHIFIKGPWFSHYHSIRICLFLKLKQQFILPYITDLEALATVSKFNALLGIKQQYAHCILHWWLDQFCTIPLPKEELFFFFFFVNVSVQTHHPPTDMLSDIAFSFLSHKETILHTPRRNVEFYTSLLFMWCCFDNLVIEKTKNDKCFILYLSKTSWYW